jgi:tyrosyl-tRNA synthetase
MAPFELHRKGHAKSTVKPREIAYIANPMSFVEELTWRGLVQQATDPELAAKMRAEPFTLYIGFDPTAESLHVGSLIPLLTLVRAQRAGHKPIALVGGATGMIGDPSFKSEERKLLSREDLQRNVEGLRKQVGRFLDFSPNGGAQLVDNYEWFDGYGYLDFLREIGKHFSVNMMMSKESVRARLEDRDQGISYTEFSYMLIQAYDFLVLHDKFGCRLQAGGSDQWGNITAGIDLVRRLRGKEVSGLTMPLVVNAQGQKFGKSEKGNVWLDAAKTPPYDFYQFFFRADDRDVGRFLRYFTFLDEPAIVQLEEQVRAAPEKREAQRVLAREVTKLVHGEEAVRQAETELPSTATPLPKPLVDVLVECGLCKSKSDARRQIEQGGVYVDGARIDDVGYVLAKGATLQRGKRDKHVITAA